MITLKKPKDIVLLREGGKRLAYIIKEIKAKVQPGVSAKTLDQIAEKLTRESGDEPAFLNYKPVGAKRPYPASLCVSINDEVVHGVPNEHTKILKEGDIVSLDMGLVHGGMYTDSAVTVAVGNIDKKAKELLKVTREALDIGIKSAMGGNHVGDIGYAIESFVKPYGFGIVRELAGHGVGYKVHEDPFVPNYGEQGEGPELRPGMVIAIEPMINEGSAKIDLDPDGYTFRTADGKRSAHFEHTVLITDGKAEILTIV